MTVISIFLTHAPSHFPHIKSCFRHVATDLLSTFDTLVRVGVTPLWVVHSYSDFDDSEAVGLCYSSKAAAPVQGPNLSLFDRHDHVR